MIRTARLIAPFRRFGVQIAAAMGLALLLGLWARTMGTSEGGGPNALVQLLAIVGASFVTLLRTLVPPLVFTAIVSSIANITGLANAARLIWSTLLWFALTATIAVLIGLLLGTWLAPGLHSDVSASTAALPQKVGGWLDFVHGLIPANFLGLEIAVKPDAGGAPTGAAAFNVLQIVVIAITIGIAALRVGEAAAPFLALNEAVLKITRRILGWIIQLTPLGTVGLLGSAVAQYGWDGLAPLCRFGLAVYLGLLIQLLLVYPMLLLAHGLDPRRFFRGAWPAIQLGFVSRSSIGTLPVTETVIEQRLGVPRAYAAFVAPFAASAKMDGCAALYPAIAALFVAQYYGIALHSADYATIMLVSILGSAATAGLTGALVMLTLTLTTLGLPLEGAGLLLSIDPILDMGRTAVNVAGQALVPTIVAKRAGLLHA